jgi:SAM-dependent methyltransferase
LAADLTEAEPGLWVTESTAQVSYPEDGHRNAMEFEDSSFWYRHRAAVITSLVQRFPSHGCVFDVGGGNGHVARALRDAGLEAVVVEPGADGARAAFDRGLAPVVNATTESAGFREATLPAIGIFDVLEHIQDDKAFLRHLHGLLVPGGRLYVTVPAYRVLWSVDDERAGHHRRYVASGLGSVAAAAGFEVDFTSYLFAVLPLPILAFRTIPSRLGRRSAEGSRAAEHGLPGGPLGAAVRWTFDRELRRLRSGRVPFGASVAMVATRPR